MTSPPDLRYVPQRYEESVPFDRLTPHPANPNAGDVGLISELLEANGFAGAILAQESTGLIIDGEHRWRAAQANHLDGLPVIWLDVDDDARDRLLASLNESNRRGRNDEHALVALLKGLAVTPRGLAGTAFDGDQLDDMIKFLAAPNLDDLPDGHGPGDSWPSVTIRAPHHLVSAWNDHVKAYSDNPAAAFAQLLGLELEP
jgi:hypothetical protein